MADHKGEAASRVRLAVGSLSSAPAYLDLATKWGSDHDPGIGRQFSALFNDLTGTILRRAGYSHTDCTRT